MALLLLAGVTLVAYSNCFRAGFVQDSGIIILEDPRLRAANGDNFQLILQKNYWWPRGEAGLYRPLTTISYLFNYSILGNEDNAEGYHWMNWLLHLGNSLLVYFLACRVFREIQPALFTAALWALHPVCTEAVTNVVGRADELAALGLLATILLYIRSTESDGRRKAALLAAMMATAAIGVFSKENAVMVAVLLPLYDLSFRIAPKQVHPVRHAIQSLARYCANGYVLLIPPILVFLYERSFMFQQGRPVQMAFVDNPILRADFVTGRLTAIKVLGKYLWLLLWPQNLSNDYSFDQIPLVNWRMGLFGNWEVFAALGAIFGLTAIAFACWRRNRPAFFWMAFGLITILPTSNLLFPLGSIMAERFLYLPAAGFTACLVVAIRLAIRKFRLPNQALPLFVAAIALAWGVRAFLRNNDWFDEESLWSKALMVAPNSFKPHNSLAMIWFKEDGASQRVIEEAKKAVAILDKLPNRLNVSTAYDGLGHFYLSKGEAAATRAPDHSLLPSEESRRWYGEALSVLKRGEAIDREFNVEARRTMSMREHHPEPLPTFGFAPLYAHLGLAYLRLDAPQDSILAYLHQRSITPGDPVVYRSLAGAYLKAGNKRAAAISLWGAFVLDKSGATTPYLLRFYHDLFPETCATYFHEGTEHLNTACALVQDHRCSAYRELSSAQLEAGQSGHAREIEYARSKVCPDAPSSSR